MAVSEEVLTFYTKRPFDPARSFDLHLHIFPDCHAVGKDPFAVKVARHHEWPFAYAAILPNGCHSIHPLHVCWICRKREVEEQGICPVQAAQ